MTHLGSDGMEPSPALTRLLDAHHADPERWAAERARTWTARGGDFTYSFSSMEQHGAVFVHVPKTAGVSVATALFGTGGGGHATLAHYVRMYGPRLDDLFVFTIVRDPVTRFLSAFHYLRDGDHSVFRGNLQFQAFLRDEFTDVDDFATSWLTPERVASTKQQHFRPQVSFLRIGDRLGPLDFVGRFERLDQDVAHVARVLGRPDLQLPHSNATPGRTQRRPLSPAAIAAVREAYRDDVELLGY